MLFIATTRITEAESDEVADRRRIMLDYAGFLRIGKMVSVLVCVWTPELPKPMLHTQLELEARVGIGRIPSSTSHSKSTVYIITDTLKIKVLFCYVKLNSNRLLLTPFYSHLIRFAGTSAGTFPKKASLPTTTISIKN
jgi:hypothetical protein